MEDDIRVRELEQRHEITASARSVAEDLGWIIAWLFGIVIQDTWGHWWISLPAGLASYFVVTHRYCKVEEAAEDAYYRAAGLGPYYRPVANTKTL